MREATLPSPPPQRTQPQLDETEYFIFKLIFTCKCLDGPSVPLSAQSISSSHLYIFIRKRSMGRHDMRSICCSILNVICCRCCHERSREPFMRLDGKRVNPSQCVWTLRGRWTYTKKTQNRLLPSFVYFKFDGNGTRISVEMDGHLRDFGPSIACVRIYMCSPQRSQHKLVANGRIYRLRDGRFDTWPISNCDDGLCIAALTLSAGKCLRQHGSAI